jgi:hypothetical protein
MRPLEKSTLPWYQATADYFTDKYVRGLVAAGVEMSAKLEGDVSELVRTRLAGLKKTTKSSYKGKWLRWERFAASRQMAAVPVTLVGVLLWIRQDLCYAVRMKHVQPYLSALNKCHEHLELPAVASGHDVVSTHKAIAEQQAAVFEETTRVRLPAEDAERVLVAALQLKMDRDDPRTWRDGGCCVAALLCWSILRPAAGVTLGSICGVAMCRCCVVVLVDTTCACAL